METHKSVALTLGLDFNFFIRMKRKRFLCFFGKICSVLIASKNLPESLVRTGVIIGGRVPYHPSSSSITEGRVSNERKIGGSKGVELELERGAAEGASTNVA